MSLSWEIREGDALEQLRELPDESMQCCITSPPYYGLRDYGTDGQLGLETTLDEYVARLVEVFREARRVLRSDGTLWLNLGDGYADKQLLGIPWRVAFALQVNGWWLRSDIIWSKPNPMPESVTDRPTSSYEHVFLLAKSVRYFYDADAIREQSQPYDVAMPMVNGGITERTKIGPNARQPLFQRGRAARLVAFNPSGRNRRNVWEIATAPYPGAHFATFPPKLVEACVLAGSAESDVVLDPFAGAGTTGLVALRQGRSFVGIELNPAYVEMARERIRQDAPLLNVFSESA